MVKKYISVPDGIIRYSLSRNTLIKLAERAEAYVHVGRKILLDSEKIDSYLNSQAEGSDSDET